MHLRGWRLTSGTPPGTGCSLLAVETPRNSLGRTHDGPTVMPWRRRAGTLVAAAAGRECSRVTCGGRTQLSCEREKARLATILVPLNACGDERSHEGARHNHAEGPRVPLQACHRSHSHGTRKAEQPSSNEAPHDVCRSCEGWPIAHAPSPSCRKNDEGPVPDLDRPPDEDHRP